jgi:hypothetical protein
MVPLDLQKLRPAITPAIAQMGVCAEGRGVSVGA